MFTWDDVKKGYDVWNDKIKQYTPIGIGKAIWDDATSSGSYSEYVSKANERTNGWYSTIAGALPIAGNIHNAILGRDRANDYLSNTGYSWSDIPGYMSSLLTGGVSNQIGDAARSVSKILDGKNDLYEFYAGEPDRGFGTKMYG